ncbi:MAG: DUF3073 domain-containing protein [Actinomycetia bacterium]|nr:DUF3073 domain-containing protein [Actinomycetes bacterium]
MGRGRAKAKQQKVARELKYNSQHTDFDALQRELGGVSSDHDVAARYEDDYGDDQDTDEHEYDWARAH